MNCKFDNNGAFYGSAFYLTDHSILELSDSTIHRSRASLGGGLYITDFVSFSLNNVTISNCYANDYGGAIYISNIGTINPITNCKFYQNEADSGGGAIYNIGRSAIRVADCIFVGNHCYFGIGGAVVCSDTSSCGFDNNLFLNNVAVLTGGAIFIGGETETVLNNTILEGNTAYNFGGGAFIAQNAVFGGNNCTYINNTANIGGAMFISSFNQFQNENCYFFKNYATEYGGAIGFTIDQINPHYYKDFSFQNEYFE